MIFFEVSTDSDSWSVHAAAGDGPHKRTKDKGLNSG